MSWLFSRVLVEEYSAASCLDGEQSAPLSGSPIPQAYCAPDKMMAFSRLSRFGMTFAALMESRGEELLTLYLEASRVRTSAQREKARELTESAAECGEKWHGSFTKYSPATSSWKTHQCSLAGDLDEFSETWPQWGLMRGGECWEQQTLVRPINETESGLWPTRTASQMPCEGTQRIMRKKWLAGNHGINLAGAVQKWPTPQTSDCRDRGNMSNPSIQRRAEKGKQLNLSMVAHPTSGQLNPTWVEWLIGWPLGWTDLKPSETDKSPCVPQQRGDC